jgi:hypothetical protein
MQDSVVGRDMRTGNVIHNHYHAAPQPQAAVNPPPPPIIIQQVVAPQPIYVNQNIPIQYYKNTHAGSWIFFGSLTILFSFFEGLNFICCGVSLIGVLSLYPSRNLKRTQPHHPEAGKITTAIMLNVIGIFLILLFLFTYENY